MLSTRGPSWRLGHGTPRKHLGGDRTVRVLKLSIQKETKQRKNRKRGKLPCLEYRQGQNHHNPSPLLPPLAYRNLSCAEGDTILFRSIVAQRSGRPSSARQSWNSMNIDRVNLGWQCTSWSRAFPRARQAVPLGSLRPSLLLQSSSCSLPCYSMLITHLYRPVRRFAHPPPNIAFGIASRQKSHSTRVFRKRSNWAPCKLIGYTASMKDVGGASKKRECLAWEGLEQF